MRVRISVLDTGVGISQEDKVNLFKPYFKTSNEQSKLLNVSTHGMGLMICHKLSESLKGTIQVQSEINCGSRFVLTFDTLKAVVKAKVPVHNRMSPKTKSKRKRN